MSEPTHPPKLLDQVRAAIRRKHYALRTEEAYVGWIRRFILFHGTRHPREMGATEVSAFLTHLAVENEVAASTQNQALSALLFLYREVLLQPLSEDLRITYAKRPTYLPTVLSREEARAVLAALSGTHHEPQLAQGLAPVGRIHLVGACRQSRATVSSFRMRPSGASNPSWPSLE